LVPSYTRGGTCIGCGLQSGIQVLEDGGQSARGGILLLITDGQENEYPNIDTVKPDLISKGVAVDTIALSSNADDKLATLSNDTRGLSYWESEDQQSTALNDAITATITTRLGGSQSVPLQLVSSKVDIGGGGIYNDFLNIDSTVGKDTVFFFLWTTSAISVTLTRPDGNIIDDTSSEYTSDVAKKSVVIAISGLAMSGTWYYEIHSTHSQTVEVAIQSEARDGVEPIHIFSRLSDVLITETPPKAAIYVQVTQGYS
ncbi:calcium-activated chloride channel regulator 3A-1-like, partial [Saccoglossus kowalevskii]